MAKLFLSICCTLFISYAQAYGNNDSLVTILLQKICGLQTQADKRYFPDGIFPAYRQYHKNERQIKPDDNIFYNGLIVYTLNQFLPAYTPEQRQLVQSVHAKTEQAAWQYRNLKGKGTFNFWKTHPKKVFPNSGWINWLDNINALPDDMDDTVMMLMALRKNKDTAAAMHQYMQGFANGGKKRIQNTFSHYQNLPAYSTWFGVKMPIDFDACVMSNVLLFVQQYQLPLTRHDSASLQFITTVIDRNEHLHHASYIAPHYATPAIVMYHISRLMAVKPLPALENRKSELVRQTDSLLQNATGVMEQILLSNALLRWGVKPANTTLLQENWMKQLAENDEPFFIANMASMAKNPFKNWIGNTGIGKFYYYCPAYNYTLFLEHLFLYNGYQPASISAN
ncbi:MAG: hypothetical protein EAZ47_09725 [Bacteroidetes bacterium]|nr:MAG: hypothetical protein EAY72_07985 [Bacteroidota bacterium]TAE72508.1 MAG: hypothetical protein EAY68_01050 [Bacteroidota bacterium]TAF91641.1 MAG: hypothetical protein EAZ47_09725 [Bacteroidota bacterium]